MKSGGDTKTPETHSSSSVRPDVLVKMTVNLRAAAPWQVGHSENFQQYERKHLRWQEERENGGSQVPVARPTCLKGFVNMGTTALLICMVTKHLHMLLFFIIEKSLGVGFVRARCPSKYILAMTLPFRLYDIFIFCYYHGVNSPIEREICKTC